MSNAPLPLRVLVAAVVAATAVAAAEPATAPAAAPLGSEQQPVLVHPAPASFAIDGNLAKWTAIAPLPAPFSRTAAGKLRLAWNAQGLFGCVQVPDSAITIDASSPWSKDCLELWLESDNARSYNMSPQSFQLVFAPDPHAGPGRAIALPASGTMPRASLESHWQPITGGYAIEFLVPAAPLKGTWAAGRRLGMNYSVDDKGIATEEFYTDKDMDSGFCSPCRWGTIELAP